MTQRFSIPRIQIQHFRRAFTLVELLVVIAIIGLLASLITAAVFSSIHSAKRARCQNNLGQIGVAVNAYHEARRKWPHAAITGNWSYRMAPGLKTADDRSALPETFGLQAVLENGNFLSKGNGLWICTAQDSSQQVFENTYAFSVATSLEKEMDTVPKAMMVWDNINFRPGLSGFRGPFSSSNYTLKVNERLLPHRGYSAGYNAGYLDGRVVYLDPTED